MREQLVGGKGGPLAHARHGDVLWSLSVGGFLWCLALGGYQWCLRLDEYLWKCACSIVGSSWRPPDLWRFGHRA
jgi:hypothetical protein